MSLEKDIKKWISLCTESEQIQLARYVIFAYADYFHNYQFNSDQISFSEISQESKKEIKDIFDQYQGDEKLHLGNLYEKILPKEVKKMLGQVFTPQQTINQMIHHTLDQDDYMQNPYLKILDPSCGAGDFLVSLYYKISEIILENAEYFEHHFHISQDEIAEHIIKNNLFGFEIDRFTREMCLANIAITCETTLQPHILSEDFLFYNHTDLFDIIIGNPPYIGHKHLTSVYKKALKSNYTVYNDKADISYCFFEKSYRCLSSGGKLSLISSRYFLEASYADQLRAFLSEYYHIDEIIDFTGTVHFKNTGISPLIIRLVKRKNSSDIKVTDVSKKNTYFVKQETLSSKPWKLMPAGAMKTYEKIMAQADLKIKDCFIMKQGIITGFDSAFIVDEETVSQYNIEKKILVNWIKGSSVQREGIINQNKLKLIYTNDCILSHYPKAEQYLLQHKQRLSLRRECLKGYRRWYDLQWSREKSLFLNDKILFPYKASTNRFVLDTDGYFFSADVYMMKPIDGMRISEASLFYLNSTIFEFLVKASSKKIGINHYEYYPYNLQNLPYFIISFANNDHHQNFIKNSLHYDELLAYHLKLDNEDMDYIMNQIHR